MIEKPILFLSDALYMRLSTKLPLVLSLSLDD